MEKLKALALFRTIVEAETPSVLREFYAASSKTRTDSGGANRVIFPLTDVAIAHAEKLHKDMWACLLSQLERVSLDWTQETLEDLISLMREIAEPVASELYSQVRTKEAAYPAIVGPAVKRIDEALRMHAAAVDAKLDIYVANRRRLQILDVLRDLESRLVVDGHAAEVLLHARAIRLEAELPEPNEKKLKEGLDVLSIAVQGINAAIDLGPKLATLISWLPG